MATRSKRIDRKLLETGKGYRHNNFSLLFLLERKCDFSRREVIDLEVTSIGLSKYLSANGTLVIVLKLRLPTLNKRNA